MGSPLGTSAMQMLLSGAMLMVIGTVTGEWNQLSFTPKTAGAMIYLVVIGSIVGYSAYVYALKHLKLSTASLYAYVNPIIAVVLGTILLSEPFSMRVVIASALVLGGIAIVRIRDQGSVIRDQGSVIRDQGSVIRDQQSAVGKASEKAAA